MSHFLSPENVNEKRHEPTTIVFDCRFDLADSKAGQYAYDKEHIPGAIYLNLKKDLACPVTTHGGRHPLPETEAFVEKMSACGVTNGKTVIAYDDQGGAMAARLWWLLRYHGFDDVYILNGGFDRWKRAGYPVSTAIPTLERASFVPSIRDEMVVSMEYVKQKLEQEKVTIIDSRAPERYRGEAEPIDPVAGHIPNAINRFWKDNIDTETNQWLSPERLTARFEDLKDHNADEIIVYCGSGVTGSANVLALTEGSIPNVTLYSGSWSDWISYPDNPIETE